MAWTFTENYVSSFAPDSKEFGSVNFARGQQIAWQIRFKVDPPNKIYSRFRILMAIDGTDPYTVYHVFEPRIEMNKTQRLFYRFVLPNTLTSDGLLSLLIERESVWRGGGDNSTIEIGVFYNIV